MFGYIKKIGQLLQVGKQTNHIVIVVLILCSVFSSSWVQKLISVVMLLYVNSTLIVMVCINIKNGMDNKINPIVLAFYVLVYCVVGVIINYGIFGFIL